MEEIYFDNSATTKTDEQVAKVVFDVMTKTYGNPSSLHGKGFEGEKAFFGAKEDVAKIIGCKKEQIFFTSGGTESNNLAIFGSVSAMKKRGNKIITTAFEHPSVSQPIDILEEQGFQVVRVFPDINGNINPKDILDEVDEKTILVSMMLVNNEVGSVIPVGEIAKKIRKINPLTQIHCDCVQGFGKISFNVSKNLDVDFLSASGHKINAPKGIGILYVKKGAKIKPIIYGGNQQGGLRSGTESVPLACGFALATKLAYENIEITEKSVSEIKNYIISEMRNLDFIKINSPTNSIPYILNFSVMGIRSETMLHFLESKGIYVSSGSACSKGGASPVLSAMKISKDQADSAIRLSFGKYNTIDEAKIFIEALKQGYEKIAKR
ncbi:MAG: cysteine desulfurase family protein [Oscillospiraceae bacterium]